MRTSTYNSLKMSNCEMLPIHLGKLVLCAGVWNACTHARVQVMLGHICKHSYHIYKHIFHSIPPTNHWTTLRSCNYSAWFDIVKK